MSILYSLIAKDGLVVLCEFTEYSGNFQQISRMLLKKIEPNTKKTIEYNKYRYHYIKEGNLTYLCLTENFPDYLAFAFLNDIKDNMNALNNGQKMKANLKDMIN